jgi:hypothetical protein
MTDPVDLDTSHIGGNSDNKVYSMITSDDKKKIVIFKIKRVNDKNFQITSLLYNNQMIRFLRKTIQSHLVTNVHLKALTEKEKDCMQQHRCSRVGLNIARLALQTIREGNGYL